MNRLFAALALVVAISVPQIADADDARALFGRGVAAFGQGRFEEASELLDRAQIATSDPDTLAQIHRQRGIVFAARHLRTSSVRAFLRALYFAPTIALTKAQHDDDVERLFACAKTLAARNVTEAQIEDRYPGAFDAPTWTCPAAPEPPPPNAMRLTAPPPPPPPPPLTALAEPATPPGASEDEDGSILSSPWLWIAIGAVAVGAGTVTALTLSKDEELHGGTTDITLRVPNR
ncbi:MAG: tetratricopeptide repeat protein [Deltaproteobacteria bacterium]